jgi:hypothetical protein
MRRRKEPLHERLAREGGLNLPDPAPHDPRPRWGETGIHGMHGVQRPRQWDAVLVAEAPDYRGDEVHFVALPDGSLLVDEDVADGALEPLAEAVEQSVSPPYRAEAVRRGERRFAVAARAIETVEVPEQVDGDEVELTLYGGGREFRIDGERTFGSIPTLEAFAARRFGQYVLHAQRLDGTVWEVRLAPL